MQSCKEWSACPYPGAPTCSLGEAPTSSPLRWLTVAKASHPAQEPQRSGCCCKYPAGPRRRSPQTTYPKAVMGAKQGSSKATEIGRALRPLGFWPGKTLYPGRSEPVPQKSGGSARRWVSSFAGEGRAVCACQSPVCAEVASHAKQRGAHCKEA